MKNFKIIALLFISSIISISCSDDNPEIINGEEVITTIKVVLTPKSGTTVTLESKDLDGDGPNAPVITGGTLAANTSYSAVITLLNETESPAEDITLEVAEEADEHQFFYNATNLNSTFSYAGENDSNGNPVGINFTVLSGDAASGSFTFTLRHEPSKSAEGVASGDITNAGGETDIEVTIPVTVE
ncbi:type 1 periplasmic binding fold superfamily protein [Tenacibaculum sp. AHE15PA]|uniref:type 1 periplasmic binding fold superfamily protein n=1 Tax=unclassified Tenacibaculum TaxID=2635139 RepID=UPI001C4E3EAE|nr:MULTISPECIES: type 1 periplasmic binding fold superfamily protein [unclassified Tenacibaculum]QXP73732.1 type 1 periplasmic binding fold superfamily protein [Tenacibaculum sp. AHE14PA]QXP75901.1 type 1 periplasmic binding fold superfamily protein [Tenacibaculum sp. AHE15PA]